MGAVSRSQLIVDAYLDTRSVLALGPKAGNKRLDLIDRQNGAPIFRQVRIASEGRPDRLIPMVSQSILEARAHGKQQSAAHVVVLVAARNVSSKTARAALEFARDYAPDVVVGIFDLDRQGLFENPSLENLNPDSPAPRPKEVVPVQTLNLFSDLNQWLLKVLLARSLNRPEFLRSPIAKYKNASELAEAANASIMSAFRLVEALRQEGFLHESSDVLQLVRVRELLRQWQAVYQRPAKELPVRWLLPSDSPAQVSNTVKAYGERCCAALFAAAHAHGFRHVTGVPIHLYVDSLDAAGLERMGVVPAREHGQPDLILRVPSAKEAVFRAQVMVGRGHRACDILQVWLDVASYPARGQEQADLIYRKVIEPMLVGM